MIRGINVNIHDLLKKSIELGASDIHITINSTPIARVKGSFVTIPTNCRAFITMENKKNKLIEKVTFDEMDTSEDPGFIF